MEQITSSKEDTLLLAIGSLIYKKISEALKEFCSPYESKGWWSSRLFLELAILIYAALKYVLLSDGDTNKWVILSVSVLDFYCFVIATYDVCIFSFVSDCINVGMFSLRSIYFGILVIVWFSFELTRFYEFGLVQFLVSCAAAIITITQFWARNCSKEPNQSDGIGMRRVRRHRKPIPIFLLNDGYEIPAIGLGTLNIKGTECEQAVKDAIDAGYRHIDTAFVYNNEKEIGNAIRAKIQEGIIKREDIFITSKLWNTFHDPAYVPRAFQKSLDDLALDYIDLYLVHSPMAYIMTNKNGSTNPPENLNDVELVPYSANNTLCGADCDYLDTWRAMEQLVDSGKLRSIGVSNHVDLRHGVLLTCPHDFNSHQIDRLLSVARIKPVINQLECHANFNQLAMLKFSADRNIVVTAFAPLGQPYNGHEGILAINDPEISKIAAAHNKLPAQIALRYTYQNGANIIPKSSKKKHLRINIDIFDFELSDEEMEIINSLNNKIRRVPFYHGYHKEYPFNVEF